VDFSRFTDDIVSFAQNNALIAIVLALVLLLFLYRRPKLFFSLLFLGLLLAGLLHLIMNMAGSGSEQKKRLMFQEEEQSPHKP
jgi:hypothetical protein